MGRTDDVDLDKASRASGAARSLGAGRTRVTASHLYDHVNCPHRVRLDHVGERAERDPISPFVQMLWERGSSHEAAVVAGQRGVTLVPREASPDERERMTLAAMAGGAQLIHGGRLVVDDLVGEPDLLVRRGSRYLAADIKSGRADEGGEGEGEEDGRPKAHYAVQVSHYAHILDRLGLGVGREAEIWDAGGRRVTYDLDQPRNSRTTETWWDLYLDTLACVRSILAGSQITRGALAAGCKLCHWRTRCRRELTESGDLTLIPQLGRALRDAMASHVPSLQAFANIDPESLVEGRRTRIPRLSPDRLRLFHRRARMLTGCGEPHLREPIDLPTTDMEIHFDIEADPFGIVYLHGFVERTAEGERFTGFFAEGDDLDGERDAFAGAIGFLAARPEAAVYYYSRYERTIYRKLCERHPGICERGDIEALFTPPRSIDLYCDVVMKAAEWPVNDHSIKTLAKMLGFAWRDTDPSGAASIEWRQRWLETGDLAVRQRILDYNEDDCRATIALLDGLRELRVAT